jgi:hypothetical protein
MADGQTGGLIWFKDQPHYWDAWGGYFRLLYGFHAADHFLQDVEIHHLETPNELKFTNLKIIDKGPVRASLQADASYGKSTIKVTVRHFTASHSDYLYTIFNRYPWMPLQVGSLWSLLERSLKFR